MHRARRACVLHHVLAQLVGQVVGLPDRERHDGQRRVLGPAGRELAAVRDEQIGVIVGLAVLVADAVLRLLALAAGTHIVSTSDMPARLYDQAVADGFPEWK